MTRPPESRCAAAPHREVRGGAEITGEEIYGNTVSVDASTDPTPDAELRIALALERIAAALETISSDDGIVVVSV